MSRVLRFAEFALYPDDQRLERAGVPLEVQPKVFDLAVALTEVPGELVTREALYERLWPGVFVTDDSLFQCVRKLRQALGDDARSPRFLATVPRRGYRWVGEVTGEAPRRPVRMPLYADTWFGRQAEWASLGEALAASRVVTVLGPGGIGKTRLAVEATRASPHAILCPLGGCGGEVEIAVTVAGALGLAVSDSVDLPAMADRLGDVLLVLDEAEGVAEVLARLLADWLPRCDTRFLVTSRIRLGLAAERVVELGPLTPDAARSLYEDRARAVHPGADDSELHIARLVERLEGWPLAIELAAARRRVLSPEAVVERLDQGALLADRADRGEHHRSLEASIAWSWELLPADVRVSCIWLAAFRSGFDLATAEQMVGDAAVEHVAVLRDHCWLTQRSERFGFPESLRAWACRQAADLGLEEEIERAWLDVVADRARTNLHGPTVVLHSDRADQAAAVERTNDPAQLAVLAHSLGRVWLHTRPVQHLVAFIEGLLPRVVGTDAEARVLCRLSLANRALRQGNPMPRALELGDLALAVAAPGSAASAEAQRVRALPLCELGRHAEGLEAAEAALQGYRNLGDVVGEGLALRDVGWVLVRLGRMPEAREALERACAVLIEAGATYEAGVAHARAMVPANLLLDPTASQQHALRALELLHPTLDAALVEWVLRHLGVLALYEARVDDAEALMLEAASLRTVGGAIQVSNRLGAQLAVARGDIAGARLWLEAHVPTDTRPYRQAEYLSSWVQVHMLEPDLDALERTLTQQLEHHTTVQYTTGMGSAHAFLALWAAARGDVPRARTEVDAARVLLAEVHSAINETYRCMLDIPVPLAAEVAGDAAAGAVVDEAIAAVVARDPMGPTGVVARAPDVRVVLKFIEIVREARG